MTIKVLVVNFFVILSLGCIMTSFAEVEQPQAVKLAVLTEQVNTNTSKIKSIEHNIKQLSSEIEHSAERH